MCLHGGWLAAGRGPASGLGEQVHELRRERRVGTEHRSGPDRSAFEAAHDGAGLDGYRAGQLCLLRSDADMRIPPDLRAERDRLELEVMELRDVRETSSEDEYFSKLESILIRIARIYEQADRTIENSKQ